MAAAHFTQNSFSKNEWNAKYQDNITIIKKSIGFLFYLETFKRIVPKDVTSVVKLCRRAQRGESQREEPWGRNTGSSFLRLEERVRSSVLVARASNTEQQLSVRNSLTILTLLFSAKETVRQKKAIVLWLLSGRKSAAGSQLQPSCCGCQWAWPRADALNSRLRAL